jgi:hypothetical protein
METVPLQQHDQQTVDGLLRRIAALVAARQELRAGGREQELEANRLEIVTCQRELNHALINLYRRAA